MNNEPVRLNGTKTLILEASEVAKILDSLAVQPYHQVANLIAKIVTQAKDDNPEDAPAG